MKKPDERAGGPALRPGGKAAERLRMLHEARGFPEDPAQHVFSDYSAAVLLAIAGGEAYAAGHEGLPQWRFVGPDRITNGQTMGQSRVVCSGRIGAIAIDPANVNHLLVGSGAGGIWESLDRGATWAPRGDTMPTLTTGAITFDPGNARNNTNIAYAGTGEGDSYWFFGQGMLRSADGGTTWGLLGGRAVQADGTEIPGGPFDGTGFYRIIVDPADSQHILAGVNGLPATGGLYETTDGGNNWTRLIAAMDCFDISMQPGGGQAAEVFAATDSGLRRSTDGGHTWAAQALPGAPASCTRLAVSISPADPTVVYAFGASGGTPYLWRRSLVNNTSTWQAVATPKNADGSEAIGTGQAGYDWYAAAAPDNARQVYLGIFDVWRGDLSADGTTWTWINLSTKTQGDSIHPDHHAIAFDPADPSTIYCAGDGGLFRSPDRGISWVSLNPGLGITEIVYMTQDNLSSQWLLAGTQDNGSIRSANGSSTFELVGDGDGGDCGVDQTRADPASPITCYRTYINMWMGRSTAGGAWGTYRRIMQRPSDAYQCLFYPPVGVYGSTVAIAGQSVFVSRDTGDNWAEVKLPPPLTGTSPEIATALFLPSSDQVYAATKTGRFFSITYSASTRKWPGTAAELTRPRQAFVSAIRTDPAGRIWVTMSQSATAPGSGQVFRSDDGGQNWADKTGILPALPLSSIAFDNANADRVWVGADVGVWHSADGGTTWMAYFHKLPYVIVEDLEFHPAARVLRAGTRSRGIWEAPADQALKACTVLTRGTSGLDAVATGTDKTVSRVQRAQGAAGGWSGWTPVAGASAGSAPVLARGRDGCLQVFVRGTDGALWRNAETTPDGPWAGWQSLGGTLTGGPLVGINYLTNGSFFEMYARGTDSTLWQAAETAPGVWSAWQSLGGVITSMPATAWDYFSGAPSVIVFARWSDGSVEYIRQSARTWTGTPGSWAQSLWQSLGGTIVGSPAVAVTQTPAGPMGLEVFARGTDNALWHNAQSAFGSDTWSGWTSLGGTLAGDPVVLPYQIPVIGSLGDPEITGYQNRVAVFARGPGNMLWDIFQTAPGSWANAVWENRGGPITSDPAVTLNYTDRHLEVYARGPGNALWYTSQAADNSSWSPWTTLGGGPFTAYP